MVNHLNIKAHVVKEENKVIILTCDYKQSVMREFRKEIKQFVKDRSSNPDSYDFNELTVYTSDQNCLAMGPKRFLMWYYSICSLNETCAIEYFVDIQVFPNLDTEPDPIENFVDFYFFEDMLYVLTDKGNLYTRDDYDNYTREIGNSEN